MHKVTRLLTIFQPAHYSLTLHLNRSERHFEGEVWIDGTVVKDGKKIALHAKDLDILEIFVNNKLATFKSAEDDEIHIKYDARAGDTPTIRVRFTGLITDGMHGIYPCYFKHEGEKKELLASQFESHHAREVFPCIDEPAAKATFDLTLVTEPDVVALGNMPIKSSLKKKDSLTTTFETTPRMSPYLVAFVVGELHKKTGHTKNGTEVSIWATKAQSAESLDFALETAIKSIEFFNLYFGIDYPLPKSDHVALPDFTVGAMENWGLITYREVCLLADEHTGITTKQYVAMVIAHELSHQWFGNLVTMKWWNDLWLNESFATLMEYICVDALFPHWNMWMIFATRETLGALRRDYLPGVQSVKTDVHHPDEINSIFDPSIVYAKGARLMAMLRAYVGDEIFRQALTDYFHTHAYKNTVGKDLWDAISAHSELDIASFMKPWLEQSGMPLVHVTKKPTELELRQERFLIPHDGEPDALWPIPIHTNSGYQLLETETGTFHAPLPINTGNTVHAVYAYDEKSMDIVLTHLKEDSLSLVDRLSLLHETSLVTRGGYAETTSLIELLDAYEHETEEPVWDIIGLIYGDLKRFVEEDEEAEAALKKRAVRHAATLYKTLGLHATDGEPEEATKLRATIISLLTYGEFQPVIDDALEVFRSTKKLRELPGELRGVFCTIAVRHGNHEDIERIIDEHHTTHSAEMKEDMAGALCGTRDPILVARLLSFMTDETIIRPQDVTHWFIYLIRNKHARDETWEWMKDHWEWIVKTFGGDKSYDNFPRYGSSGFSTRKWLQAYKDFFEPYRSDPGLARAIELGIKDIEGRTAWIERDGKSVLAALKSN